MAGIVGVLSFYRQEVALADSAPAAVLRPGLSGPFGSGPEAGDGVDFEEAEVVPAAILEFLLAGLG